MAQIDESILESEIRDLVAKITETDPEKITSGASFVEDLGMDSMMALEILAAIEKKYKIQIPEEKLGRISNLTEVMALTKEYTTRSV